MLSQERAIEKLDRQIATIPELKKKVSFSLEFTKWWRDTKISIQKIFGENCQHTKEFENISFGVSGITDLTTDSDREEAYQKGLERAKAILLSFVDEINNYWDDRVITADKICLSTIEKICHRFHLFARQLRSRRNCRPTLDIEDEYDVQYLLHAILMLHFDDIRSEEGTPSTGSDCFRWRSAFSIELSQGARGEN